MGYIQEKQQLTMCIIHKGFSGFRALSPASILGGFLIGLTPEIPYEIIHLTLPIIKMDYTTFYEFTPRSSNLFHLIGILLFVLAGFGFAFYTKRSDREFSLFRRLKIFFGYLIGGIALIMFLLSVIKIPKIISYERELNEIIDNQNFLIVQGEIENFSHRNVNGQTFESFTVQGEKFEYSDYIVIDGFHQTSENNGPIRGNGQQVRISYKVSDNENLIMKLEIKKK